MSLSLAGCGGDAKGTASTSGSSSDQAPVQDAGSSSGSDASTSDSSSQSDKQKLTQAGWMAAKYNSLGFYLPAQLKAGEKEEPNDERNETDGCQRYYVAPDGELGEHAREVLNLRVYYLDDNTAISGDNKDFVISELYEDTPHIDIDKTELKNKFGSPVRETEDLIIYHCKYYELSGYPVEEGGGLNSIIDQCNAEYEKYSSSGFGFDTDSLYILIKNTNQYYKIDLLADAYTDHWDRDKVDGDGYYIRTGDLLQGKDVVSLSIRFSIWVIRDAMKGERICQ